jgi:hypothetical protein
LPVTELALPGIELESIQCFTGWSWGGEHTKDLRIPSVPRRTCQPCSGEQKEAGRGVRRMGRRQSLAGRVNEKILARRDATMRRGNEQTRRGKTGSTCLPREGTRPSEAALHLVRRGKDGGTHLLLPDAADPAPWPAAGVPARWGMDAGRMLIVSGNVHLLSSDTASERRQLTAPESAAACSWPGPEPWLSPR